MKYRAIFYSSAFLVITSALGGCRKGDPFVVDTPVAINQDISVLPKDYFPEFLSKTNFTATNTMVNQADYELGYEFKPNVNGEISSIAIKIPNESPKTIRVTLWNVENSTILLTTTINSDIGNNLYEKSISPIPVLKNWRYAITMNTQDWYHHKGPNDEETIYPITVGELSYTRALQRIGTAQVLPSPALPNTTSFASRVSFKFKPTN